MKTVARGLFDAVRETPGNTDGTVSVRREGA
jgi:hypothetical protein